MRRELILSAVLLLITAVAPARAELVFFQSGRAMSVKAIRSDGDELVLQLRSGGEIRCDKSLITKVEPDEIEYPEEVLAGAAVREGDSRAGGHSRAVSRPDYEDRGQAWRRRASSTP